MIDTSIGRTQTRTQPHKTHTHTDTFVDRYPPTRSSCITNELPEHFTLMRYKQLPYTFHSSFCRLQQPLSFLSLSPSLSLPLSHTNKGHTCTHPHTPISSTERTEAAILAPPQSTQPLSSSVSTHTKIASCESSWSNPYICIRLVKKNKGRPFAVSAVLYSLRAG